jgi:signal transduction histidine kinase/FixJ family two-component response regulator
LIYASFTFIFFALEAAIMSMALQMLLGIPLAWAYVISALVVIPLVTHGISRISRFQLWTQPLWLVLQIAPLLYILLHHADAISHWTQFSGSRENEAGGFDLLLFGAAAAVIFPLMAQNGEQVDFLRFLPKTEENSGKWWLALVLAGPGWSIFGLLKLFAGSFLAVLALQHGIPADLADDPSHMYLVAFGYIVNNPDLALVLAGVFVVVSQLKINVTNAYAGSLAWSNFFSRVTHSHPGRIVWLFFNVAIALLLMELGLYQAFETILITYSTLVLAWMGSLVADLVINRSLGLRPRDIEFKRGHLYDINPVGVLSMIIASGLGIASQMGVFGPTLAALAPFVALFIPFVTAPAIAELTAGRYYLARGGNTVSEPGEYHCTICENSFEGEDISHCPAYGGHICSLCCALDSNCEDRCRPDAHLQAQLKSLLSRYLPASWMTDRYANIGRFLGISLFTSLLVASLFALVYLSMDYPDEAVGTLVGDALIKTFVLLAIVTGVLVWLYVLAQASRRKALAESRQQTELLRLEAAAHQKTARELQSAKEAAVAANQAKSRYLSGVSHELRTPLNTVLGYAQLLEGDNGLRRSNRQAATAIRRNGEHLADVIEGLLEISKIEARRLDLQRAQVNLRALLEQLVEVFAVQARARNLTFEYLPAREMPDFVMADEKRLRQVLTNLLSNAVKFTREGGVTLECNYRNQVARFVVSDTGIGIRSEDQERIFAPFERIHNEQTRFIGGTGLGLAITRLLCNLMGGDIELQSEFSKGTRFTLRVMLPALRDVPAVAAEPRSITGYQGRRRTLLVVDDQASHRGLIRDFLVPLGFNVLEAHSAEFCLQLLGESDVDGFLLDVAMPLTDGWSLVRELRAKGVESPVVMISGNAVETHGNDLEQRLHDAYLVKPIRLRDLLETLGNLLQLEWTRAAEAREASPSTAAGQWVPSQEQLQELVAMARIGYLSGVQEKLDALESAAPDSGFLRELRKRADLCDFDGLIQIMKGVDSGA